MIKDDTLQRLANIVVVRNHTFTLLNGSRGFPVTKFGQHASRALGGIINSLDDEFINELYTLIPKEEENVEKPTEPSTLEKPKANTRTFKKTYKKKKASKKQSVVSEDDDIKKRLAEEKSKLQKLKSHG